MGYYTNHTENHVCLRKADNVYRCSFTVHVTRPAHRATYRIQGFDATFDEATRFCAQWGLAPPQR